MVACPNGATFIAICYFIAISNKIRLMQLISNKALRDFATIHPDAGVPLQAFRSKVEKSHFANFAALRATFRGVDKVGDRFVFNIGGNKYRLIASIAFSVQRLWIKAVLIHAEYDKGDWK